MKRNSVPLLSMKGIHKRFPGVHALRGVDVDLHNAEVLALIGENGAGKSTLIKMLGGAHQPTQGIIYFLGRQVTIPNPKEASKLGIGIIYQEFNLVPYLSARENIFLGRETRKGLFIDQKSETDRAANLFKRLGSNIDPNAICNTLSIAERQIVEIAKALSQDVKLLVMDEPTATLTPSEVEKLFGIIKDLTRRNIGVIYISHRLDEVFEIADRVCVLRDGSLIAAKPIDQIDRRSMIEMMVGRTVDDEFPKVRHKPGPIRLQVEAVKIGGAEVSFHVKGGEVLGLTGLIGAGRTEVARIIFGADPIQGGRIRKDGQPVDIDSPADAIRNGIGFLTEDRKGQGLILIHSAKDNFGLPNLDQFSHQGILQKDKEHVAFQSLAVDVKLKSSGSEQLAGDLSGGNQQKVVLMKWLQRNCDVLIFDEPTRGIDVGAKYEIYMLMNELAARGKAIIMISSELPEVLGMSDRILIFRNGAISGEITDVEKATQEDIMELAVH